MRHINFQNLHAWRQCPHTKGTSQIRICIQGAHSLADVRGKNIVHKLTNYYFFAHEKEKKLKRQPWFPNSRFLRPYFIQFAQPEIFNSLIKTSWNYFSEFQPHKQLASKFSENNSFKGQISSDKFKSNSIQQPGANPNMADQVPQLTTMKSTSRSIW